MPEPPAKVRATKPTRQSNGSIPLYSARPPATPPTSLSVLLRRSCARPGGVAGGSQAGSADGGAGGGADVMPQASVPGGSLTIGERPHPTLVRQRSPTRVITGVRAG